MFRIAPVVHKPDAPTNDVVNNLGQMGREGTRTCARLTPVFFDHCRRSKIQGPSQPSELEHILVFAQNRLRVFEPLNQSRHGIGPVQRPFFLIPDGLEQQTEPVKRFTSRLGADLGRQLPEGICVSVACRPHPFSQPLRIRGRWRQRMPADDPLNRRIGVRPFELFTLGSKAALDGLAIGSWRIEL